MAVPIPYHRRTLAPSRPTAFHAPGAHVHDGARCLCRYHAELFVPYHRALPRIRACSDPCGACWLLYGSAGPPSARRQAA